MTLAAVPIVVSSVSAVDYGKFVTAMAIMGWILPLTAPAAVHGVAAAAARGQDGTLVFIVRERSKLAVPATAIALGAGYYVARSGDRILAHLVLASAGYILLGTVFLTYRQFLVGKRAFRELAPWDVAAAALPSVGMALAALTTRSIVAVAVAAFAIQILVGVAGYVWVVRKWNVREHLKLGRVDRAVRGYGLRMMPLSMVSALASEGATFVAAYVLGYEQLAVLAVADRLFNRLSRIAGDIGRDVLRPEFASRDEGRVTEVVHRHLGGIAGGLGGLWAVCCLGGATYLAVFMPVPYRGAVWLYVVMSLGLPARILQEVLLLIPSVNLRAVDEAVPRLIGDVTRVVGTAVCGYLLGRMGIAIVVAISSWIGVAAAFYWGMMLRRRSGPVLTSPA